MEELNRRLFLLINHFAGSSPWLDKAGVLAAAYMPLVFALWMLFAWVTGGREKRHAVLMVFYAGILGLGINFAITRVYFHPRPFMVSLGTLLIPHAPETSFPSDHATLMFALALAALAAPATRREGGVLLFLGGWAAWLGYSAACISRWMLLALLV